jgi:DNA polymerase alpha subunit B
MAVAIDSLSDELRDRFSITPSDEGSSVLRELQSIIHIHDISPEDLSYKWDSYCMKMGAQDTQLSLKTVREFKKDLQENLERESRAKLHTKQADRKPGMATPRAGFGGMDVLGILAPNTPRTGPHSVGSAAKRRAPFETPVPKSGRSNAMSSPSEFRAPDSGTP